MQSTIDSYEYRVSNLGAKKTENNGYSFVPVVQYMQWRQLTPQHLHGHHVDNQHPDGTIQNINLSQKVIGHI
jgi:hypothetical protein